MWFLLYFRHGVDSFIFHKILHFFVHWLVWHNFYWNHPYMLIDNDNNLQKILQVPWKGQLLFHFYLQRLVRCGKHIFARVTDNGAFYLDITVCVLYTQKCHLKSPTWLLLLGKEPSEVVLQSEAFLHLNKFSFVLYFNFI